MTTTIVVAPHPDDEVLGCASVLSDSTVTVVHVTNGVPPWTAGEDRRDLEDRRARESDEAWGVLSTRARRIGLGFADLGAWPAVEPVAEALARVIDGGPATEVYLPAYQGGHPDHDATCLAGMRARQLLGADPARSWRVYGLYGFDDEHQVRFGWLPPGLYGPIDVRGDDDQQLHAKAEALGRFSSQIWPGSALDQWIRLPVPERFAPLPPPWDRVPELPCYYDEVLGFARHGASADTVAAAFNRSLGVGSVG